MWRPTALTGSIPGRSRTHAKSGGPITATPVTTNERAVTRPQQRRRTGTTPVRAPPPGSDRRRDGRGRPAARRTATDAGARPASGRAWQWWRRRSRPRPAGDDSGAPRRRAPSVHASGSERARVAAGERCGGRSVAEALPRPRPDGGSRVVQHRRRRLVADPPSGCVESPDEVDVLAEAQRRVEPADGSKHSDTHHDGGGRDVADSRTRANRARAGPRSSGDRQRS